MAFTVYLWCSLFDDTVSLLYVYYHQLDTIILCQLSELIFFTEAWQFRKCAKSVVVIGALFEIMASKRRR